MLPPATIAWQNWRSTAAAGPPDQPPAHRHRPGQAEEAEAPGDRAPLPRASLHLQAAMSAERAFSSSSASACAQLIHMGAINTRAAWVWPTGYRKPSLLRFPMHQYQHQFSPLLADTKTKLMSWTEGQGVQAAKNAHHSCARLFSKQGAFVGGSR